MQQKPAFIICSYTRDGNHYYLHIPKRSAEQCGLTSGCRFLGFVGDGKLVIEQEKITEQEVESGTLVGLSSAKTE